MAFLGSGVLSSPDWATLLSSPGRAPEFAVTSIEACDSTMLIVSLELAEIWQIIVLEQQQVLFASKLQTSGAPMGCWR